MPSPEQRPFGAVVKLTRGGQQRAAGVGVMVGLRHVVTCAHVVNAALALDSTDQADKSGRELLLEFPLLDGRPVRWARVTRWEAPPRAGIAPGDLAALEIVGEGPPETARPVKLGHAGEPPVGVWLYGYPGDPPRPDGGWTEARFVGPVGNGLVQLDKHPHAALAPQPGFSGTPLFDESTNRVVGLLSAAPSARAQDRPGVSDSYAIPAARLEAFWPDVCRIVRPSPYRGLTAFESTDAAVFVGRDTEADRLAERVERDPLTCVIGPSGVGKSSLLHAGLVPRLSAAGGWTVMRYRPRDAPLTSLAVALLRAELRLEDSEPVPVDPLRAVEEEIRRCGVVARATQLAQAANTKVLVIADQFEECLPVDGMDEGMRTDAAAVVRALLVEPPAAATSPVRVLIALRSDRFGELQVHPDVRASLDERVVSVQAMAPRTLRRAALEPAERQGVQFAPGLVDQLVRDAGNGAGRLPLLEFALGQLWETQRGGRIEYQAYEDLGAVSGALGRHAESVAQDILGSGVDEPRLRHALLALFRSGGDGTLAMRRTVRRGEGGDWPVLLALARARLVVLDRDGGGTPTAELAHEALLDGWGRLAQLVEQEAEFVRWRTRLEQFGDGPQDLLPETWIAEAQRWLVERPDDIPVLVRDLVERSAAAQARTVERLRDLVLRSDALRLAAEAELLLSLPKVAPAVPRILAAESLRRARTVQGDLAARRILRLPPRAVHRFEHGGAVASMAFSPDGRRFATASYDQAARVFDLATGLAVVRVDHGDFVHGLAFSPDGQWIATACGSDGARVFEAATGAGAQLLATEGGNIGTVAFSPDGRYLAAAGLGGASVFETVGWTRTGRVGVEEDGYVAVHCFSPDSAAVVATRRYHGVRDRVMMFASAGGGSLLTVEHDAVVAAAVLSPTGQQLVTGWNDGVRVIDVARGAETVHLELLASHGPCIAYSPTGRMVAVGGYGGGVRVFDPATWSLLAEPGPEWPALVAFSPEGRFLAIKNSDSGSDSVCILDTATWAETAQLPAEGLTRSILFSPDGWLLATGADEGEAQVFDAVHGWDAMHLGDDQWVSSVAISPGDGRYVATGGDDGAQVFSMVDGSRLGSLRSGGVVRAVAFSPDGRYVVAAGDDRDAAVFDAVVFESEGGAEVARARHDDAVLVVAFSPKGRWVAAAARTIGQWCWTGPRAPRPPRCAMADR